MTASEPPDQPAARAPVERTVAFGPEREIQRAGVAPESPDIVNTIDGQKILSWSQLGGNGTVICIRYVGDDDLDRTPARGASQGGTVNDQPVITADDRGGIGIFWRQSEGTALRLADGSTVALEGDAIVGRFFDSALTEAVTDDVVIADVNPASANPKASTDKNGNTIVTWEEDNQIKGRRLGRSGNLLGPTFDINDPNNSSAVDTVVDSAASGDFVSVWIERRLGFGVRARLYGDDGLPKGGAITVSTSPLADDPQVAMSDDGSFAVVWEAGGNIFTRLYDADGRARGNQFIANQNTNGVQRRPVIDANGDGDLFIVWESDLSFKGSARQSGDLVGRFFDPLGQAETDDVVVATEDASSSPETPKVTLDDRDTATVVFDRRGAGNTPEGIFRRELRTEAEPSQCVEDANTVCLNGDRFRVTTSFEAGSSDPLSGAANQLTEDTGFFTFFDPANVEVVVKVLDGCAINGNYWVFASGLTNVEVDLRVEDTRTGQTISYFNRNDNIFAPVQDTGAFATCSAKPDDLRPEFSAATRTQVSDVVTDWLDRVAAEGPDTVRSGSSAACSGSATTLCLTGNRFEVSTSFRTAQGNTGTGRAIGLTPDTGYFWFFEPDNVEVVIKVLDACGVNGRYWVFAGGLTDVRVEMTVVDTDRNQTRNYLNPLGTPFATITDTNAFNTCP
ncbi:MAG: hypothetical protein AAGK22_00980 [Acidobacteriota bacterium]